ncbi:phosphoribosylamine--glycine ligase [Williamwhitmania taraxaci]|uniref:Phosphoribosylamine--glycine ligase n=1 Tax=Williamwhitmania taraxaci TaxID=1640674 RepID=A0A1G6PRJ6_9BACT|nr:phosphoribosylamine--glycine ligase [Williamwhitmania taraxaci]SDC82284.1 phosphoribosylamine--glycine ligase [Williamwhitmania taraxaci]
MKVLLIGSGGREHAIALKLSESKLLTKLFVAPGNPGTAALGENVPLDSLDFDAVSRFVHQNGINMVIVGPEEPLVKGLGDYFKSTPELSKVGFIGPCADGAQLEGSKDFAKVFMVENNIPTARYQTFTANTLKQGKQFLTQLSAPYVLKADGLAAGKGVIILNNLNEAQAALEEMLKGQFGEASSRVVIEEFLSGIELSVFVLTDGKNYTILPEAKDYKRIGEGDVGLNTGGMGAISPVPFADVSFMNKVEAEIVKPTMAGLKKMGITYKGFIFLGLINVSGNPFVIEYNVRMGDPETEAVFPRISGDVLAAFKAVSDGSLTRAALGAIPQHSATVMLVSGGYPEHYHNGYPITLDKPIGNELIFHAGSTLDSANQLVTAGGRVIAVTALGDSLKGAIDNAYAGVETVHYEGMVFRKDIGFEFSEQ